jgi:hypothetical protein
MSGWFMPELDDGSMSRSLLAAQRRWSFLLWLGIPGPEPYFREFDECVWNGQFLPYCHSLQGMWAHEIGHWLVAAPARRKLEDFGLGELSNDRDQLMSLSQTQIIEEHAAVLLGAAVMDAMGFHKDLLVVGSVRFEGWHSVERDPHVREAWHWLGYHGLLGAGDNVLTGRRRDWEDGEERRPTVNLISTVEER